MPMRLKDPVCGMSVRADGDNPSGRGGLPLSDLESGDVCFNPGMKKC